MRHIPGVPLALEGGIEAILREVRVMWAVPSVGFGLNQPSDPGRSLGIQSIAHNPA